MNFWIGIVFFCVPSDDCFFYKPHQTFSSQQACFKEVGKFVTEAETAGAKLVRGQCLYIETGKTVNGKESISKP